MKTLKLERPLASIDVEGTGTDPVKDRIVALSIVRVHPGGGVDEQLYKFNPGVVMTEENITCHGITNEMAATFHPFNVEAANTINAFLEGCDLLGYNLGQYDLPIISETMARVGVEFSVAGRNVVDAGNIFKKKEPRDLSAALKFYAGKSIQPRIPPTAIPRRRSTY